MLGRTKIGGMGSRLGPAPRTLREEWRTGWWLFAVLAHLLSGAVQAQGLAGTGPLSGVRGIHDPSMIKQGATWYVFGSGGSRDGAQFPMRCSEDLQVWRACGFALDAMPSWIAGRLPGVKELWAPDISLVGGEYRMYYAYSILGKNTSGIALMTNKTLDRASPDYAWVDRGFVLESHADDDWNAIDPNFIQDAQGNGWLDFGSFWSGIKMRRLGADGKLDSREKKQYSLAKRAQPTGAPDAPPPSQGSPPWQAVEGPFVVRHGEWFYLFTSWDLCCRGAQSTYRVMAGRSKNVNGPFTDRDGKKLMQGGGTEVLVGNATWAGPGGESVWVGPDRQNVMVFHAYDRVTGRPMLQVGRMSWPEDWPVVAWP